MCKKSKSTEITQLNPTSSDPITGAEQIANSLNMHFTQIGPKLSSEIPSLPNTNFKDYIRKADSAFCFNKILPGQVLKLLKGCNIKKAVGIDNISNKILKIAGPFIYESLTKIFYLFNQTLFQMTGN